MIYFGSESETAADDADGQVLRIPCEKDYFLNIIFQYNHESAKDYRRFRVMMNRDGIKNIEEIA